MPRRKKELGRPARALPPRIDASPEQIAEALLRKPLRGVMRERDYRCKDCDKVIHYPEVLNDDERCELCAATFKRVNDTQEGRGHRLGAS